LFGDSLHREHVSTGAPTGDDELTGH